MSAGTARPVESLRESWVEQIPVLPLEVYQKIGVFIRSLKTGQITLNLKEGKVMSIDIRESIRV